MENENKEIQEKEKTANTVLFYFLSTIYILAIGIKICVSALFDNDFSLNAEINIILNYYIKVVFTPCIVFTLWKYITGKLLPEFNVLFGIPNYKNIRSAFKWLLIILVIYIFIFVSVNLPIEVPTVIISVIEFSLMTTKKLIKLEKVDIKIRSSSEIVDNLLSLTTVFFIINLIGFLIKFIPIILFKLVVH
ncbi:hypothetical protein [Clostridium butyricum]|nr:hypothetical protein [Clostridium butyricum]